MHLLSSYQWVALRWQDQVEEAQELPNACAVVTA